MNDPNRYQKEFDLMMQELEAEAKRRTYLDRETTWKIIEKSFNRVADTLRWTEEEREARKEKALDLLAMDHPATG